MIFNCFPHCFVHDRWVNTNRFYCLLFNETDFELLFNLLPWQLILYNPSVKKKTVWRCDSYLTGLPIVLSLQVEPSINYQLYTQFLTITVTVYFPFIQPCWAKWLPNAIDKLIKVKDLIFFFFYSGRNSINFELRSLTLSSTSKEVNTLFLSRIIRLTD